MSTETLTVAMIRDIRRKAIEDGDEVLAQDCLLACEGHHSRAGARARVAAAINNARAKCGTDFVRVTWRDQ